MSSILVTGGTGTLGRPTVTRLRALDDQVRVLSRDPGPDHVVADLTSGEGLAAVEGSDVIVHLATSEGRDDVQQTRNLLAAAPGVKHLVVMSIAGIDRIPMPYYRYKLEAERLVAESGVPYTILRATQFHNLIDRVLSAQRFLPAVLAPAISLQPIAVEDVAVRLAELVAGPPVNARAADIGGPERLPVVELARRWKQARAVHRPVVPLRLAGKAFRAFAAGAAMVDGPAYGHITFAEYLR
ncbi:SDR family oxidoreductase [Kribbella jiaozuonensis]|uniref:NAD-dependent epimerase/dehydratase family protein n=1 Tax=Kribbella jiaozuonensis TaxID=2575441 RepID=A0A4U3LUY0_9ACTN|nr:NAD(P)H-binding protein [Kribbella jiaozuonensis]TKK79938.1 NAD-dependent epimerase/dehydratase family protein [Kribbella jiaozuonensis]